MIIEIPEPQSSVKLQINRIPNGIIRIYEPPPFIYPRLNKYSKSIIRQYFSNNELVDEAFRIIDHKVNFYDLPSPMKCIVEGICNMI